MLVSGTRILRGIWLVSEVFGNATTAEVTAIITETLGPLEELMNPDDPTSEYVVDIFRMLTESNKQGVSDFDNMEWQQDVDRRMRAILVDWIVEYHAMVRLETLTLFLAISLIDLYLQQRQTPRRQLQLLGITCLSIAAKFADTCQLCPRDLAQASADFYTVPEVAHFEVQVLNTLGFKACCAPTAWHFEEVHARASGCSEEQRHLVHYLLELALVLSGALRHAPGILSAAAFSLAGTLLGQEPAWSPAMVSYTGYYYEMLGPCVAELRSNFDAAQRSTMHVVQKFARGKHGHVVSMTEHSRTGQATTL